MRRRWMLIVLFCGTFLHAQDLFPRPYAFAGPKLMGGGYAPVAALGGAGFRIDSARFVLDSNAYYVNAHKTNDNDQPNPMGRDRGLMGTVYYRLRSGWMFGVGARWSELSTTKYSKSAWHPTYGGGRDFFVRNCAAESCIGYFTMRVNVDYVTRGTNWQNGTQGPLFSVFMPSPSLKKHIYYRETIGIYRFHDTVTDRSDPILTRIESSNQHFEFVSEITVMYRF